ncbi:hypothetical protein HDV06_003535 [Boothiomyces sp. JEL0866]|nr:hypothetical protein HDV06_003535 [Boothiomyces sp. JEL0866]
MEQLPVEILEYHILNYLKGYDIIKLSLANKYFRNRLQQFQKLFKLGCTSIWPTLDLTTKIYWSETSIGLFKNLNFSLEFQKIEIDSLLLEQVFEHIPNSKCLKVLVTQTTGIKSLLCALETSRLAELVIDCRSQLAQEEIDLLHRSIGNFKSLKSFNLGCNQYHYAEIISDQLSTSSLVELSLANCDTAAIRRLSHILPTSTVQSLMIGCSRCTHSCSSLYSSPEVALSNVVAHGFARNLKSLGGYISYELLSKILLVLPQLELQEINFKNEMDDGLSELLIQQLPKSHLTKIELTPNHRFKEMLGSVHLSKVKHLTLNKIDCENACLTLGHSLCHLKLESLALSGKFSGKDLHSVFSNIAVDDFYFDGWIQSKNLSIIEKYLKEKSFRTLKLNLKTFEDSGFQYLAPTVKDISVHNLEVYWNDYSLTNLSNFVLSLGPNVRYLKMNYWAGVNTRLVRLLARKYPKLTVEFAVN